MIIYDDQTRSMVQTDQQFLCVNSQQKDLGTAQIRRFGQQQRSEGHVQVSNNGSAWWAGGCRRDGGATRRARVPRAMLRSESPDLGNSPRLVE